MSYYYNCIYYLKYYKKIYFKNTLIILTMSYSNYIIFLEEKKGEKFRKMKEKEVVRYNNDLNTKTYLKNFNAVELNFFMAICSKLKAQGTSEIKFTFSELKKKIQYDTSHNTDNFINKLRSTNRKILNSICEIETKDYIEQFVLFPTFSISKKNGTLTVKINQDYAYLLNDFSNFTEFGLANFIKLSSKYIKLLYKELMQFKSTGKWNISLEDFKRIMDVPVNYRMCDIDVKVLKPIQKELKEKYGLKIQKTYNTKGRGRPAVSGFIFTFLKEEPQSREIKEEKKEIKTPADFFIHRKVRMMDGVTGMFNTLTIKSINEQKNGMVVVKIQNVDDFYEQEFAFNSMEHFENWFRKYVI